MSTQQVAIIPDRELDEFSPTLASYGLGKKQIEKFKRVVSAAVTKTPALAQADRRTLWLACQRAAADGLMPDGNEAFLNVYNTREGKDGPWIKKVQYIRMVNGLLKLINETPAIKFASHGCVFKNDSFKFWKDMSGEHIEHYPNVFDRGEMLGAYAFASTAKGGNYAEVLSMHDIAKIRACSKTPDKGPWVEWFEEKSRAAALKRLAKRLPITVELAEEDGDEESETIIVENAPPAPRIEEFTEPSGTYRVYDQWGEEVFSEDFDRKAAASKLKELVASTDVPHEIEALKEVNGDLWADVEPPAIDTAYLEKTYRGYVEKGDAEARSKLAAWLKAMDKSGSDYVRKLMAEDKKRKSENAEVS